MARKKTVQLRPMEMPVPGGKQATTRLDLGDREWSNRGITQESEPDHRYNGMMASFAAMVRGEKTNPYTPDYELELFRLILQCCGVN